MSSSDLLAILTALIASIVAPYALSIFTGRQAKVAKKLQWARDDEVAEKAAEVAAKQLRVQQEALARTETAARIAATETLNIKEQLTVIHTLVNNDMTIARQNELDETRDGLKYLRQSIALTEQRLLPVDQHDADAVTAKQTRIGELERILEDRRAIMVQVEHEQKAAQTAKEEQTEN